MKDRKKIFLDTNLLIDVLLVQQPHFEDSKKILNLAETKVIDAYIAAHSVTNIIYMIRKYFNKKDGQIVVKNLLKFISVVSITHQDIEKAFDLDFDDYEDALQTQCAIKSNSKYIVTRNPVDFNKSTVEVIEPSEFLKLYGK